MMKWPQGRPGLNGELLGSGQKPVNIRRRDVSHDERGGQPGTDYARDRRTQFKVEKTNMPPRPGINRPLRSKKPSSAIGVTQLGSYNSAQKTRDGS
jgi:hypothetical protein